LIITVDPASAKGRYEHGLTERRAVCESNDDGTANVCGYQLPAARAQGVMRRINRLARAAHGRDDPRTMDQVRADVFLDLLAGRDQYASSGRDRAVVDLRADLTTLIGLDDKTAEIPGWGPVIADIARQVAAQQLEDEWRVTVTDPETGMAVWTGTSRRRPTAAQRREVEARNPTCTFPGCRIPAAGCDIDHHTAWAQGGPTQPWNNGPLCRHDHRLKDKGWTLEQVRPGYYRWTSPLGHTYLTGPDPP
jgi:hypothetical protein